MGDELRTTRPARSVMVVEDNALMRSLIVNLLSVSGFEVSAAACVADARKLARKTDPDVALVDIKLGDGPDGFDLARMLRKDSEGLAIVFLTSVPDARFTGKSESDIVKNAAYLNKNMLADSGVLLDAIEAALTQRDLIAFRHDREPDRPMAKLSKSQLEVLGMLAEGKTNLQIAELRKRSLTATESLIARTILALGINKDEDVNGRVVAALKYFSESER